MCTTGNGTTLTIAGYAGTFRIVSIEGWEESIGDIEDNDISIGINYNDVNGVIDHMQYCPGRIIDHGELIMNSVFDPVGDGNATAALIRPISMPLLGLERLATLTFPLAVASNTSRGTLSGDAWIRLRGFNGLESNVRTEGSINLRFKGGNATTVGTAPNFTTITPSIAFTPEAA